MQTRHFSSHSQVEQVDCFLGKWQVAIGVWLGTSGWVRARVAEVGRLSANSKYALNWYSTDFVFCPQQFADQARDFWHLFDNQSFWSKRTLISGVFLLYFNCLKFFLHACVTKIVTTKVFLGVFANTWEAVLNLKVNKSFTKCVNCDKS